MRCWSNTPAADPTPDPDANTLGHSKPPDTSTARFPMASFVDLRSLLLAGVGGCCGLEEWVGLKMGKHKNCRACTRFRRRNILNTRILPRALPEIPGFLVALGTKSSLGGLRLCARAPGGPPALPADGAGGGEAAPPLRAEGAERCCFPLRVHLFWWSKREAKENMFMFFFLSGGSLKEDTHMEVSFF